MTEINPKAYPLATNELTSKIMNVVNKAHNSNIVKKGINEATKALNRGKAQFVIIAADVEPFEITMALPLICEDKNVPYCYIGSKSALGRACGVSRPVVACAILIADHSDVTPLVQAIHVAIEKLLV